MTLADLQVLFDRVRRITGTLEDRAGPGTSWDYTFPDGTTTTYEITNVMTHAELLDHFASLAVWTWSIKDYIKTLALANTLGITPQAVEAHVNQDPALPLCADIANMLKHGVLKESRSGRWPVSVTPSYSITHDRCAPASPIREISVSATAIRIDIANPALVEVQFKVKARDGSFLPDGLAVVADAISSWEGLLLRLGTKVTV